ncbi:hypothetical protein [Serratia aquatilis]|uniref:Uncharacterized protein n=1 Tax=Serratia aquatilis TaxID=1737515 RepID=A0ABV6E7L6_9GAMM
MALPERQYYPLDLAAKKLKCDINDLLHYASIGLLELCISTPERYNSDEDIDKDENLEFNNLDPMIKYINKDKIDKSVSRLNIKYETINTTLKATYNVRKETYGMVNITGLLALPFNCIRNIDCSTSEYIEPIYLTLPRTEEKVTITDNIAIERIFFSERLKI